MEAASEQQRLQVLTHQNQRLAVQLEEKRRETRQLESKVSDYESKESEYEATLLCVNRLWEQLQNDVRHLCTEACASVGAAETIKQELKQPAVADPFLARLLRGASTSASKAVVEGQRELEGMRTELEDTLVERASSTQEALGHVLDCIRQLHVQRMAWAQQRSDQSDDDALKEEHAKMSAEATSLRQQLSHSCAESRTAKEKIKLSEDRVLETEQRIKQIENELADKEQQLSSLQRKFAALKEGQADTSQFKDAGTHNAAAAAAAASLASTQEDGGLAEELQQLQALLEKRNVELEKAKESHLKTKR